MGAERLTMTDTTADTIPAAATATRAETFNSRDFWHQLQIALEFAADDPRCDHLVMTMIDQNCRYMPQLDSDTARDTDRLAMLRQALAICARH
jgi:hypothetical protein